MKLITAAELLNFKRYLFYFFFRFSSYSIFLMMSLKQQLEDIENGGIYSQRKELLIFWKVTFSAWYLDALSIHPESKRSLLEKLPDVFLNSNPPLQYFRSCFYSRPSQESFTSTWFQRKFAIVSVSITHLIG